MNIVYKLKWRRGDLGFWHSLKVIGHQYETGSNKLILYFPEGGLREIAHWDDCEMLLGSDWSKLVNDDSGNVDSIKEKLKIQQDIIPPGPDPNIEEISEKKEDIIPSEPDPNIEEISEKKEEEISEKKEEEIDDRNSS